MDITYSDQNHMTLIYRGHSVSVYGILFLFVIGSFLGAFSTSWFELVIMVFLPLYLLLYFFAKYTATVNFDKAQDKILFVQKGLPRKKEASCTISEIACVESRKGSVGKYPTSSLQLFLVRKDGADAMTLSPLSTITTANTEKFASIGTQIANFLSLPFKETVAEYQ